MRPILPALVLAATFGCRPTPPVDDPIDTDDPQTLAPPVQLRVATFNASLSRDAEGQLLAALQSSSDPQPERVLDVLDVLAADVVLINEFDRDQAAAELFAELAGFEHWWAPPTNTGLASGVDLDGDGVIESTPGSDAYAADAYGFGTFEGQYGMLVLSRFPLVTDEARSFQTLRWTDLTDPLLPDDFYAPDAVEALRLSSKNHIDLPVEVDGHQLHLLVSHPTPPSFDGPEDRNGRRNHDEIRLWVDYLDELESLVDDAGTAGGLADDVSFVLLGDLNADPVDGESRREALLALLAHPRVQDPAPTSEGGPAEASDEGDANLDHQGDPALDTADFTDGLVGNLRVDYALPSTDLDVVDAGVFWPLDEPALNSASDHHPVWVDVVLGAR